MTPKQTQNIPFRPTSHAIFWHKILRVNWALGFKRPYYLPFELLIFVALAVFVVLAAFVLVVFVVVAAFVVAVVVVVIVALVHKSVFLDHRRLDCF